MDRLSDEKSSATGSRRQNTVWNPYSLVSFVLGFLTGVYAVLTGARYYYAGWPAHGPVGVVGLLLIIFGLVTILGSFFELRIGRLRIAGGILILVFGLMGNMQGIFSITNLVTRLSMPILSFIFAVYAVKWDSARPV